MLTQLVVGGLLFFAVYWLPGFIWLRRTSLDIVGRSVIGVALSYSVATAIFTVLGAADLLDRPVMVSGWVVVVAIAVLFPVPEPWLQHSEHNLRWPLAAAGGIGLLVLFQALRPAIFRTNDALTVWAPLASDIGDSGTICLLYTSPSPRDL